MKKDFIFLVILFLVTCFFWITSMFWDFSREWFLQKDALDTADPYNVTINQEVLKTLGPAYE